MPVDRRASPGGPSAGAGRWNRARRIFPSGPAGLGRAHPAGRSAGLGRYRILGETLDDAAGEAFDKTAKLLGLGYPGGPALAALAEHGREGAFEFPRPMLDRPGLDFSFSGLKTAVVVAVRGRTLDDAARADVARGFEAAMVDTLVAKSLRALRQPAIDRSSSPAASARIGGCASAHRAGAQPRARPLTSRARSSAPTMPR